jgi:hypothetical protein
MGTARIILAVSPPPEQAPARSVMSNLYPIVREGGKN